MTKFGTIIILSALLIGFAFVACCISHNEKVNTPTIETTSIPTPSPTILPVPTSCPEPVSLENTSYTHWVTINPISNHNERDTFEITGTIQYGNNTTIHVIPHLYIQLYYSPGYLPFSTYFEGNATIMPGNCEVRQWIYPVNLSRRNALAPPGEYMATAYTDEFTQSTKFNITSGLFINISPINEYKIGDIVTLTGDTSFGSGELINLNLVSSDAKQCLRHSPCPDSVQFCCGGIRGETVVTSGDNGTSLWSWSINTSQHGFTEGSYLVTASGSNSTGEAENSMRFNLSQQ